ncbi:hypothetical protein J6590_096962, partial [Homalodisca vitripennis]
MDETVSATSVYWVIRYSRTLKAQRYHLLIFASYDGEDDCNGPTRVRTPLVGHNGWWAICGGWVVSGGETTIELRRHPGRSSWTTRDRNRKECGRYRPPGVWFFSQRCWLPLLVVDAVSRTAAVALRRMSDDSVVNARICSRLSCGGP